MSKYFPRLRLRFSLALLLLFVTAMCVWLGRVTYLARQQREAVRVIENAGGRVIYDFQRSTAGTNAPTNPGPKWLVDAIGPEYFQTVEVVDFASGMGRNQKTGGPKVSNDVLKALARLPDIEVLELSHNESVDDDALEQLQGMRNLESLHLFRCNVKGAGLVHLRNATSLLVLILQDSPVDDDGLKAIGDLRSLQLLNLSRTAVTDVGMVALGELDQLEHLSLKCTAVTDAGLRQLEQLKSLKSLELVGADVTLEGVDRFTMALPGCIVTTRFALGNEPETEPIFPLGVAPTSGEINVRLRELGIDGDVDVDATHPDAPIESFRLSDSMRNGAALTPLLKQMPQLRMLNFRNVSVGDEFVRELAAHMSLNYVSLKGTDVTDAGLASLSGLKNLAQLELGDTKITDQGLPHLYPLKGLHSLSLEGTRVSRDAIEKLKEELPDCNVQW